MTSPYISHEYKTKSGTIKIPDDCILVYALVDGSINAPVINSVGMTPVIAQDIIGAANAVSIHQYKPPISTTTLELGFTFEGNYVDFIYLKNALGVRPGGIVFGYGAINSFTKDLPTSVSDFVIGILSGLVGPTDMKGDSVEFTYTANSAFQKVGYLVPGDSNLTCLAEDTGTTPATTKKGKWHPPVLIHPGYWTYDPVKHTVTYKFDHRSYSENKDYFKKYDNGVYVKMITVLLGSTPQTSIYYTYPGVWHPPEYSEGYYDIITVPAGPGQVACAFVSISTTTIGDDAVNPILYQ